MKKQEWKARAKKREAQLAALRQELEEARHTLSAVWQSLEGPVMSIESVTVRYEGVFAVDVSGEVPRSRQADLIVLSRQRMKELNRLRESLESIDVKTKEYVDKANEFPKRVWELLGMDRRYGDTKIHREMMIDALNARLGHKESVAALWELAGFLEPFTGNQDQLDRLVELMRSKLDRLRELGGYD